MERQSSLGIPQEYRLPNFNQTKIGRVSSTARFDKYGFIEVVFLDYSKPAPVWVVNNIDRKPVEGDMVIVGYIDGRKDAPYLVGFVKNHSYTTNFVYVSRERIRIQLPKFQIGIKDGDAHKDVKEYLLKEEKLKKHRAYVELDENHAIMSFPYDPQFIISPVTCELTKDYAMMKFPFSPSDEGYVKITKDSVELFHPKAVKVNAGQSITLNAPSVTANGEDLTTDLT